MLPSVLPRLATDSAVRVFPGVWKPLFLRLPSRDGTPFPGRSSLPTSFVSFFVFYIFPTCFWRQWSAFLGAWCPLPAFRSCFVEFTQRWNVLLMNLWGRKWSPRPIPPPSSEFPQHGILSSKVFLPVLWWPNCISLNHCFDSPLLTDKIGHSKMIYSQIFFFCGVLFRDDVHSYFAWPNPKVFIAGFVCFFLVLL